VFVLQEFEELLLTAAGYYCYPYYLANVNNNQPFAKHGTHYCTEAFWQFALWQYLRNSMRGRAICDDHPELEGLNLDVFNPPNNSGKLVKFSFCMQWLRLEVCVQHLGHR
jgi:hypothetical protein